MGRQAFELEMLSNAAQLVLLCLGCGVPNGVFAFALMFLAGLRIGLAPTLWGWPVSG
jgi:hypothetical protein